MPLNKETKPNQLPEAVEYTDCFSAKVYNLHPNLMVRLQ